MIRSFLLILILCTTSFAQVVQPKLVLKQNNFDFGDIKEGETVTHTFVLSNSGEALLKITEVKASCGCTAAVPEKKELKPGESTNLVVKFNSSRRQGKQSKKVRILSNDPQNPEMVITFTGNVIPQKEQSGIVPIIYFTEIQHNFGKVVEGQKLTYTFKLANKGSAGLIIKNLQSSKNCTAAIIGSSALKPGQEGGIKVEFDTKNCPGKNTKTITVQSNDPKEPSKVLTIYADVVKKGV